MYRTITVRDTERAFVFRNGQLYDVLGAGKHRIASFSEKIDIERYDVITSDVPDRLVKSVEAAKPELMDKLFLSVQTGESQVAIIYVDGLPTYVLEPWRKKSYWKVMTKVSVDCINTADELRPTKAQLNSIDTKRSSLVQDITISQNEVGLLFIDGKLQEELSPGRHAFWSVDRDVRVDIFDLRPQTHEITAQEILTKDRISLRVTLTAFTKITEPKTLVEQTSDYANFIYRLVQFAVREAIANRTLDEVLNDRETIDKQIRTYVDEHIGDIGVIVTDLGVKDIILPGEMRELINRVVEAEKMAQANLIRRREETAATRSLLNTAKLMENNPTLMRLKELEALEKLTEKVGKIELITGKTQGFDGLLSGLLERKGEGE